MIASPHYRSFWAVTCKDAHRSVPRGVPILILPTNAGQPRRVVVCSDLTFELTGKTIIFPPIGKLKDVTMWRMAVDKKQYNRKGR